jgi:hypothetical protein
MKTTERYLWIAGLILAGFVIQNQFNNNSSLQTLLVTYDAESKIQDAQINDFSQQLGLARDASYSKGFEDGRTQAGVILAHKSSLYSYTDGYHAALSQFGIADEYGKGLTKDFVYDLVLNTLDQSDETEANYLELLDLLTDTNTEEANNK